MAKSIWDEFTDLFKTDAQKKEEKQNQINDALEKEKNILDSLSALDKEYKDSLPQEEEIDLEKLFPSDSGIKEISYNAESDDDIAARAERENSLSKQQAQNSLENKYEAQKATVESNRQKAEDNLKSGYEKLRELYDDLRKRTENDVLKRGLARSSVATAQLDNLDAARMAGVSELQASYNSSMADIDDKIAGLENEKLNALEELDIKSALQLEERIAELKKERDKTVKEYEEYNNQARKQNADYQVKRQENIDEYLAKRESDKAAALVQQEANEKKYGYSGAKQENYAKRYDIAFDFYTSLDPDIAADALAASPNMKYYLGIYYDKLLKVLKGSGSSSAKAYY
ncbi:MAG: hypothetical protein NC037_06170 [Bacteroides sp.]|nr:hypothetical protein [Bacillota bacterium]MCM1393815.1 hypothetical protein [[Eubacterium] siraeum]MCM1456090.1 hypothetical protein [Bacteroides sp.]